MKTKTNYAVSWHDVPEVIDAVCLSQILGCSRVRLSKLTKAGKVPGFRLGREWRYNKLAIMRTIGVELGGESFDDTH